MRHLLLFCLMTCACACANTTAPPRIENSVPVAEAPTLERNMAATVTVHYNFWDTEDSTPLPQSANGVVIDDRHVLVRSVEFIAEFYKELRLEEIRIGPLGANFAQAPWEARVASSKGGLTILETSRSIPKPCVVIASNPPRVDDDIYAVGIKHDEKPLVVRGLVVTTFEYYEDRSPEDQRIPAAFETTETGGDYDTTIEAILGGIYNERNEMVGFGAHAGNSFKPVTKAQKRLFGSGDGIWVYSSYMPSIQHSVLPLLQQAGIDGTFQ